MTEDHGAAHRLSVLEGGLRLVTAAMAERVSASVAFMVGVGSRIETASTAGLAHFVEHMLFKGAGRFPTAWSISEAIEGIGGTLNAETDREMTVYWAQVPGERLDRAVAVLADMFHRPVLDPVELSKERQVVIEELRMSGDNPQDRVNTVFDDVLWPDHPLGWDIAGREETVRGFEREQCRDQVILHHQRDNLVVSVAGAVDHEEAAALVEQELAPPAASRPRPAPLAAVPPAGTARVRVENRETEQANIVVGGRSASYLDAERFAVDLLNGLLGDGMASRLFVELRERRGLAYDVHSFTTRHRDSGALAMYLGCEPARAEEALAAAIAQLVDLASSPVEAAELGRAREHLRGRMLIGLESTSVMAGHLGQQLLLTGGVMPAAEVLERIEAVSPEEIRQAAAAVLESGLHAAVVGPFPETASFDAAVGRVAA